MRDDASLDGGTGNIGYIGALFFCVCVLLEEFGCLFEESFSFSLFISFHDNSTVIPRLTSDSVNDFFG